MIALRLQVNKFLRCLKKWICQTQKLWMKLCRFWRYLSARRQFEVKSKWILHKPMQKKDATWSYHYKLVGVDDRFSKFFKSHLGNDGILLIVWLMVVNTVAMWLKTF